MPKHDATCVLRRNHDNSPPERIVPVSFGKKRRRHSRTHRSHRIFLLTTETPPRAGEGSSPLSDVAQSLTALHTDHPGAQITKVAVSDPPRGKSWKVLSRWKRNHFARGLKSSEPRRASVSPIPRRRTDEIPASTTLIHDNHWHFGKITFNYAMTTATRRKNGPLAIPGSYGHPPTDALVTLG